MDIIIKSLYPDVCDTIDEVFGSNWRAERTEFYEDGMKVYDVRLNLECVLLEVDGDVWLKRAEDDYIKIDSQDFLEIVIR